VGDESERYGCLHLVERLRRRAGDLASATGYYPKDSHALRFGDRQNENSAHPEALQDHHAHCCFILTGLREMHGQMSC
jgi:hypothetical protein